VEPKGEHLLKTDAWKEDFLKLIETQAECIKEFADDVDYRIIGLPFYTHNHLETFQFALQRFY
jgi:type III restriction enzyme